MKRLLLSLGALLVLASPALAQNGTLSAVNTCRSIGVDDKGTVSIQVTGTWAGTLTWYVSHAGAARLPIDLAAPDTPGTAVNSTTANGGWQGSVAGWEMFEVCMTAYTSGTATIFLNAVATGGGSGGGGGGSGGEVTSGAAANFLATVTMTSADRTVLDAIAASAAISDNVVFGAGTAAAAQRVTFASDAPALAVTTTSDDQQAEDDSIAFALTLPTVISLNYCSNGTVMVRCPLGDGGAGAVTANTQRVTLGGDPCSGAKTYVAINQTTGTQLFTGTASMRTYVCYVSVLTATAQNVALVSGTGTVCATSLGPMMGGTTAATGWNFAANSGISAGSGTSAIAKSDTDADNVCLLQSSTGQISGVIAYVAAAN